MAGLQLPNFAFTMAEFQAKIKDILERFKVSHLAVKRVSFAKDD